MKAPIKIKQKDVARELGIGEAYLSEMLNGKRRPSWEVAKRCALKTGSSPLVWMEGTGDDIRNLLAVTFSKKDH
jgi:transcriptional regulator with XRE-family HTH domain